MLLRCSALNQLLPQVYVPDEVLCLAFDLVGNVITGDSHGCLQVWSRDEEDAFVAVSAGHLQHAHKDRITAVMVLGDGTLVSASQNSLRAWDTLNDYCLVKERLVRKGPLLFSFRFQRFKPTSLFPGQLTDQPNRQHHLSTPGFNRRRITAGAR